MIELAFVKGQPKLGGRKKGSVNKTTATLKDMILEALERKGGVEYLMRVADNEPTAFVSLLNKVLPMQVSGDANSPVQMVISWGAPSNES